MNASYRLNMGLRLCTGVRAGFRENTCYRTCRDRQGGTYDQCSYACNTMKMSCESDMAPIELIKYYEA